MKQRLEDLRDELDTIFELYEEMRPSHERGSIIQESCDLDFFMEKILKKYFIEIPEKENDYLFDANNHGILSDSTSKINMLYRLGIIDKDNAFVLKKIYRIRNDFAHNNDTDLITNKYYIRIIPFIKKLEKNSIFRLNKIGIKMRHDEEYIDFLTLIRYYELLFMQFDNNYNNPKINDFKIVFNMDLKVDVEKDTVKLMIKS